MSDIDTSLDPKILGEEYVQQMRDQQREERLMRLQEQEDFKKTFETPWGRRVFWRLLIAGHYVDDVYRKGAEIYKAAAERDFVMAELINHMSEADPELLADILTQGLRERAAEKKRLAQEEQMKKQEAA